MQLIETPPKKRRYPPDSFVLSMTEEMQFRLASAHDERRININCLLLPDDRVFCNEKKRSMLPIEVLTQASLPEHIAILTIISHNIIEKYNKIMVLHVDKINIKSCCSFVNKRLLLGSAHNNITKLANNILTFLLSDVNNRSKPINAGAILTNSLNSTSLKMKLEEILDKLKHADYVLVPIIFDRAAMNVNLSRNFITE